jgi:hypothetical protein
VILFNWSVFRPQSYDLRVLIYIYFRVLLKSVCALLLRDVSQASGKDHTGRVRVRVFLCFSAFLFPFFAKDRGSFGSYLRSRSQVLCMFDVLGLVINYH